MQEGNLFTPASDSDTYSESEQKWLITYAWGVGLVIVLALNGFFFIYRQFVCNAKNNTMRRKLEFIATSSEDKESFYTQTGYRKSAVGQCIFLLWCLFVLFGEVFMLFLILDHYQLTEIWLPGGLAWSVTGSTFIVVFVMSHAVLFAYSLHKEDAKVLFMVPTSLSEATWVLCKENDPIVEPSAQQESFMERFRRKQDKAQLKRSLVKVQQGLIDNYKMRFYEFTCIRYMWVPENDTFSPSTYETLVGSDALARLQSGLSQVEVKSQELLTGKNQILVEVPSPLGAVAAEFTKPLMVFQSIPIHLYLVYDSWNIGLLWLILVVLSAVFQALFVVRRNCMKIADMARHECEVKVLRMARWQTINTSSLVPGDVFAVREGQTVPCDAILLQGGVVTTEAMLTGEPMPVQKFAVEERDMKIEKKNELYAGTYVVQASNGSNISAVCMCTGTGGQTAKGCLVRMVLFPTLVKDAMDHELNVYYVVFSVFVMIQFLICVFFVTIAGDWVDVAFAAFSIFSECVNPMMPVSISWTQSKSSQWLEEQGIRCIAPNKIPVAGKVHCFVFDKTGTITKDSIDLLAITPVKDSAFVGKIDVTNKSWTDKTPTVMQYAMGTCHTVTSLPNGTLVGNLVEVSMVKVSGWALPDQQKCVTPPNGLLHTQIVKEIPFEHTRMTSGSVIQTEDGVRTLIIKGSYEKIVTLCRPDSVPSNYKDITEQYAADSYYVLAVCARQLSDDVDVNKMSRDELEQDMELIGLLLFRNEVKGDSESALEELKAADIRCVMCTGDNALTGVAVARRTNMITPDAKVIIANKQEGQVTWRDFDTCKEYKTAEVLQMSPGQIELVVPADAFDMLVSDGTIQDLVRSIRVYARMKPDQKVSAVKFIQDLGLVVGMVGDGGNDCAALKSAHVGLALSDAEASLVAPFSTGQKSLHSIGNLVKVGRGCLSTVIASTWWYIFSGVVFSPMKLVFLLRAALTPTEWGLIYISIIVPIGITALDIHCKPSKTLAAIRPTACFFGKRGILSLLNPILTYWACIITAIYFLMQQDYYSICRVADPKVGVQSFWTYRTDSYDMATSILVSMFFFPLVGLTYSFGFEHRRNVLRNYYLIGFMLVNMSLLFFLLWGGPSPVHCLFRIGCDSETAWEYKGLLIAPLLSRGPGFDGPQLCHAADTFGNLYQTPMEHGGMVHPDHKTFSDFIMFDHGMPWGGFFKDTCNGPNNCFDVNYRMTLTSILCLFGGIFVTLHWICGRTHPAKKVHFARQ